MAKDEAKNDEAKEPEKAAAKSAGTKKKAAPTTKTLKTGAYEYEVPVSGRHK